VAEVADDLGDGQVHDLKWLVGHMTPVMWLRAAAIALSASIVVGVVIFALVVSS
jgi:hypothetical protein